MPLGTGSVSRPLQLDRIVVPEHLVLHTSSQPGFISRKGLLIMRRFLSVALWGAALLSTIVVADNQSLDAAIGGAVGGGLGAYIGNEVGGRDGAIIGGALGGATGAAITTDEHHHRPAESMHYVYPSKPHYHEPPRRGFCPPGQAKKGRC